MASRMLFVCLLALVAGSLAQSFPYCACERKSTGGPYAMTLTSETPLSGGGTEVCYDLVTVNADATGKCTKFDLRKIEFDVAPGCRGAVDSITFGGKKIAPSFTAYKGGSAVVFKITKGGKGLLGTYADLSKTTTEVCFTLESGDCSSVATFIKAGPIFFNADDSCCIGNTVIPPPPSPIFVPGPFPFCRCTRTVPEPSYVLEPLATDKANTYCWNLVADEVADSPPCTNYDLKKIEFNVGVPCRFGSVASMSFAGKPIAASFSAYPAKKAMVLKFTRGNRPLATFDELVGKSTPLCITLRPTGACPDLATLCKGKCMTSIFSVDEKCCPVALV